MQSQKEAIGIMSLRVFVMILFIVLFATCFIVLQDTINYIVTNISAQIL